MFGVERGAFTGADRTRPGLFQTAHRGTLFLDEIGLVPEALQSKLLKAIEERTVRRLGRVHGRGRGRVDHRRDQRGPRRGDAGRRFRRDLYHRLAVMTLRLPPLRARGARRDAAGRAFPGARVRRLRPAAKGVRRRRRPRAARAPVAGKRPGADQRRGAGGAASPTRPLVTAEALGLDRPSRRAIESESRTAARTGALRDGAARRPNETGCSRRWSRPRWNLSQAAARLAMPRNTLRYRMERLGLRPPPPSRRHRFPTPAPPSDAVGSDVTDRSWSQIGGGGASPAELAARGPGRTSRRAPRSSTRAARWRCSPRRSTASAARSRCCTARGWSRCSGSSRSRTRPGARP